MSSAQLKALASYTACDISDALLKLNVPSAGFLADLTPIRTAYPSTTTKTIAPASTVLLVSKPSASFSHAPLPPSPADLPEPNIKPGIPYADLTTPHTVVLLSQPAGQKCAVVGGIMAVRMKVLGARGIVTDGRVRDLETLGSLGLPVWSRATSTIGAGAEAKAWAHNVPITISGVQITPGDIIVIDPSENGIVSIPQTKLDAVLELLPRLVAADEKVIEDVEKGVDVGEAFRRHRSNL
ncbi:DlpA domain-containing protein [Cenococcum geophilum 1.58]|uniref:DlpA domain-containing protein n=1 Tax=Cenococcum geophilum 1.58 TaxID=794803 RepID=UPI00358EC8E3|nr:DlpA domain-containing protein [Cenococcum geophilum 1.58]